MMSSRKNRFALNPQEWLLFMALTLIAGALSSAIAATPWWNSAWGYRVRLDVDAGGYARYEKPVERALNFTALFSAVGTTGALNENSIRVIEVNGGGTVVDSTVVFQFDRDPDYEATTKASGTIVILMKGTTSGSAVRHYDVYFDNRGGFSAPSYTGQVSISTVSDWEGQESFKVVSTRATYYYHKFGGGFASAIDANGHDWISYHPPPTAFLGEYRGIPNMGRCAHPGYTNSNSTVVSQGPVKITILSQTNDSRQKWYTAVYPHYVTITVARSDSNYWFLYEGTPGGALVGATQFVYKSNGDKSFLDTEWSADIPGDEWAYFSDPGTNRSLYMIHHEQDDLPESYWNGGGDGMTVFGFGRERSTTNWFMTAAPQTMSFGIMDGTGFSASSDTIRAIFKAMSISQGSPEKGLPSVPAAPALSSPANGATGLSVPLLLQWNASAAATAYRLQVSTQSGFSSGIVFDDSTLVDTSRLLNGLGSKTTCYWRVSARNSAGSSVFSGSWQFQTALGTPSLVAPANAATGQKLPVTARWTRVTGATSYHLQAATNALFSPGIALDQIGIVDSLYVMTGLLPTTPYYWRVSAADAGGEGSFSSAWIFTTSAPAPVLVAPPNDAVDQPLTVKLVWRYMAATLNYHVQVSTDAGFGGGIVLDDAAVSDTSKNLPGLNKSTRYYWRVSAIDAGGEGPFSSARNFSTYLPPPVLLSPADAATGQSVPITFRWAGTEGAIRYHLQLATDAGFTTFIKNDTTITDTVRVVSGLGSGIWHYWRVSARSGSAASPFSGTWSFRTLGQLPGAVTLLTPAQDFSVALDSVLFSWRNAVPSTRYWMEIGLDSLFVVKLVDSTVTDTVKSVRGLLKDHTYWWKVWGGIADAWGPFSETRRFVYLGPAGVDGDKEFPTVFALGANYPNPFNPSTILTFSLPAAGEVRIEVYSMLGECVATLVDEIRTAGNHAVTFNASGLASGTYFTRMSVQGKTLTRRILLLR
jgi:hypothetical protein